MTGTDDEVDKGFVGHGGDIDLLEVVACLVGRNILRYAYLIREGWLRDGPDYSAEA